MLNVFFTVDVEIWCDGWSDIDNKFSDAFRKYIYGSTVKGDFGLPYQLKLLNDHGLNGVFYVEPLFSKRFGGQPLADIVGLISDANQEVQLHLHPEWVDESKDPIFENISKKRQHLFYFSFEEQTKLIDIGKQLLQEAGVSKINSFRAGGFGFNLDTIKALAANGLQYDSSYNATKFGMSSGIMPNMTVIEPIEVEGIFEYPVTVFKDGLGKLRHVQVTACSYEEIESVLWKSLKLGRKSVVILFHSFELLNSAKNRPDNVVVNRFNKLCSFLDRERDLFNTCGFKMLMPDIVSTQPDPLGIKAWRTGKRTIEQVFRRVYR